MEIINESLNRMTINSFWLIILWINIYLTKNMEINFKNTDDQRKKFGLAQLSSKKKDSSSVFGSKPKGGIFGGV